MLEARQQVRAQAALTGTWNFLTLLYHPTAVIILVLSTFLGGNLTMYNCCYFCSPFKGPTSVTTLSEREGSLLSKVSLHHRKKDMNTQWVHFQWLHTQEQCVQPESNCRHITTNPSPDSVEWEINACFQLPGEDRRNWNTSNTPSLLVISDLFYLIVVGVLTECKYILITWGPQN